MILSSIDLYWNDQKELLAVITEGTVRAESIQLSSLIGTPQYRLDSGDAWTNLDVSGSDWRFEVLKAPGTYELELQDGGAPGSFSVFDFEIQDKDAKCGRAPFVDIINYVQITQTQILFNVTYPNLLTWQQAFVDINSVLEAIPGGGLLKNFADIGNPFTGNYEHEPLGGGVKCVGPDFTAYQPSSGSSCDLVVQLPTITQPDINQANGVIEGNATSSGTITWSLDSGPFQSSNTFSNLAPGEYVLTTRDDTGNCSDVDQDVILNEKYFRIPVLNAVQFTIPDSNRPNLNNTPFNNMKLPYRNYKNDFCQRYFDNEILPIQFQSNFLSHTVQVRNYETKALLSTIVPVLVYDSPENFQYWEYTINLSLYSGLTVYTIIVPLGETLGGGYAGQSEPLKMMDPDDDIENELIKVQYSSNKNHSDIYWQSGFAPFLYVRGQVAGATPQINKEVSQDCEWNVNTQSRELKKLINFKVKQQPYYVFEKLIWALGNGQGPGNFYYVNDVSVNSEDAGFDEPDFPDKYSLADSEAKLQERNVFAGDLSSTPTPVETANYLLVNPNNDGGLLVSPNDEITFV